MTHHSSPSIVLLNLLIWMSTKHLKLKIYETKPGIPLSSPKPALPAAFPISVNGNSMLSVAWLKKLVVTLDFFFSHTQYLVYQPILLALFSEYIYPESNHFSPSLSLPPWSMLPSPLTLIPLPTPLHSYPFRSIFNITDKMILLKETKLDHILRWNP